ncbi:MAG: hypothetical protein RR055_04560 [Oscillospiraceae bacterium]
MTVSFEGIGEKLATFYNTATTANRAVKNQPVKVTDSGEVSKCAAGERFMGVALTADSGFVAVQFAGYVEQPYTGTPPAAGYAYLVANGTGGVKTDTAQAHVGGEFLVIEVDKTNGVLGFIL